MFVLADELRPLVVDDGFAFRQADLRQVQLFTQRVNHLVLLGDRRADARVQFLQKVVLQSSLLHQFRSQRSSFYVVGLEFLQLTAILGLDLHTSL